MSEKKRISSKIMVLLIVISSIFGTWTKDMLYLCADRDPYREKLLEDGFPVSYLEELISLHKEHPNWIFEPVMTGLGWQEVLEGEMQYRVNLTPNTPTYPSSYHAKEPIGGNITFDYDANAFRVVSAPNWVQASKEAVAYYMDPRNFLTVEDIFQFEAQIYDAQIHSLAGVERILAGSFMEDAYVIEPTLWIGEGSIANITVGMTCNELRDHLDCMPGDFIDIWKPDGSRKEALEPVGSGDIVTVSEVELAQDAMLDQLADVRHKLYICHVYGDITGDGAIDFTDYIYMKRHIYDFSKLEGLRYDMADLNQDGAVDFTDYIYLKRQIYGFSKLKQPEPESKERREKEDLALFDSTSKTFAQYLMQIADELNLSPYMLAVRLRQEQGASGKSSQISGVYPGFEGYYNFFNILASGASQEDIIVNGLTYAMQQGWNTKAASIRGGAMRIAEKYISFGQNTLYFQKFNVLVNEDTILYRHQYMQNLLAAKSEGARLATTYEQLECLDEAFLFRIPVYEDMPEVASPVPDKDGNPNPYLAYLTVDNVELAPVFSKEVLEYFATVEYNVESVSVSAEAIANILLNTSTCGQGAAHAIVAGTGEYELMVGENLITVLTASADGTVLPYLLHIIRMPDPDAPKEESTGEQIQESTQEDTQTET